MANILLARSWKNTDAESYFITYLRTIKHHTVLSYHELFPHGTEADGIIYDNSHSAGQDIILYLDFPIPEQSIGGGISFWVNAYSVMLLDVPEGTMIQCWLRRFVDFQKFIDVFLG